MQYRYFVDFWHGISVFTNFSYGIAVLGTPTLNIPLNKIVCSCKKKIDVYICLSDFVFSVKGTKKRIMFINKEKV